MPTSPSRGAGSPRSREAAKPGPRVATASLAMLAALAGCDATPQEESVNPHQRIVELLAAGEAVFGIFSGEHTPEQGRLMAENRAADFVFYSLESGPFDIPAMQAYAEAMDEAAADRGTHPIALRIPPIRDGHEQARVRVRAGLDAGAAAVVFPHVETAEEAALAVDAMGDDAWPERSDGTRVNMLLIEDRVGIENVRQIVSTPGVSVVFPGPGDLRRAYDGDMEAVEHAIQTVLAACEEFGVPCGVTAGVDDIAERLEQGFQVIIVTGPEALTVGRRAAGRPPTVDGDPSS